MSEKLSFDPKLAIIEQYGPGLYRLGVEGVWVEFVTVTTNGNKPAKPSRQRLLREIDDMNRKRPK